MTTAMTTAGQGRNRPLTREPRVAHRVPCQIRTADALTGLTLLSNGETVNLSHRGVAIQLGRDVPTGTNVEVRLSNLDGGPAFLYGCVIHSRRVLSGTFEVGIAVTDEFRPS
jgi:hypothetical protein